MVSWMSKFKQQQKKFMSYAKKQEGECATYTECHPDMLSQGIQMLDSADKDHRASIVNMFKEPKKKI